MTEFVKESTTASDRIREDEPISDASVDPKKESSVRQDSGPMRKDAAKAVQSQADRGMRSEEEKVAAKHASTGRGY
ncbi:hypothetical protein PROFUN_03086 [Planoprotostelium fungivorum]|uniref:Uncharacterized protein n=1 Tax=Planoprotostelium fungivorum TaxID=1890364 RepID=A0A2P6NQ66_9EUKA|nr:hypothetical protein PROFUN_03086 [Planoprotostelium fungivorum]